MAVVAYCYTPGVREKDCEEARRQFERFRSCYFPDTLCVDRSCTGDFGYFNVLSALGSRNRCAIERNCYIGSITEPIVIWEQDIVPQASQVASLLLCKYPQCAFAYRLWPKSTCLWSPVYAHRDAAMKWIPYGTEYAAFVGLGLTKLPANRLYEATEKAWRANQPWHYSSCDTMLSAALLDARRPWHIHWPEVKHNHA